MSDGRNRRGFWWRGPGLPTAWWSRPWTLLGSVLANAVLVGAAAGQDTDAALGERVRELLRQRCVDCHGGETREAGLRLDSRTGIERGGDFGPVVQAGQPEQSELLRRVTTTNEAKLMPPDGEPLAAEEIALLREWIAAGAAWPSLTQAEAAAEVEQRDPRLDHWAWQALMPARIPETAIELSGWENVEAARSPIDRFIRDRLATERLAPSPAADRRHLIRRLYFDLHGLPPAPEAVAAFVMDPDPLAYEKLVDRLLASPRYGERWARHWLDVVHYGDTHGYDKDQPRPHAWPYRDYVIRAFNEDKPYARFIQEQVAGDVLFGETRDGQEALGLIAAGPWDLIGHLEVPETKTDGKIARHLDRDDMVANTIGTFNSVTIHCAQCHQHKFDPVTQEDYYALQAVFAAIDRDNREYSTDPEIQRQWIALARQQDELQQRQVALQRELAERGGQELARLEAQIATAGQDGRSAQGGYHSQIEASPEALKWVQIDLGQPRAIHNVVLHPCYDDFNGIGAGFGFPVRFRIEAANDAELTQDVITIADRTAEDVANPGIARQTFPTEVTARYVRISATRLAPRSDDYIFALAEIEVLSATGENLALGQGVESLDSIEAAPRWTRSNAADGVSPALAAADPAPLQAERQQWLSERGLTPLAEELAEVERGLAAIATERNALGPRQQVYAATTHKRGGQPRPIHFLARGNVLTPLQEVPPGTLSLLEMLPSRFDLPQGHSEGERRVALARWLSNHDNPLTWRSIVNRVWQYHFGRGLVSTADDFGLMGSTPSHPELLDWLAGEFRDNGGSFKWLHRQIVCSATYRQSSGPRRDGLAMDVDNRLLWRQTPRRLEAEAIRDSVLAVAGTLDLTMGGPGWQDFVVEHPEHSPHYKYELADPADRRLWRRSVYRFIVRSQTQPFLTVLDCADPSMRVDRRNQSISALQALALLNNGLMLVQASEFAARLRREVGEALPAQVTRAHQLALGRAPDAAEQAALEALGADHGLENVCRALFNLNEFVWID